MGGNWQLCILLAAAAAILRAQAADTAVPTVSQPCTADGGTISGVVLDPSGALVSGAVVKLTVRGRALETRSDRSGGFTFGCLRTGVFEVRIQQEGFAEFRTRVRLGARNPRPLEVTLALAQRRDAITVSGDARQLNIEISGNLDAVQFDSDVIDNLPIFGNDVLGTIQRLMDTSTGGGIGSLIVDGAETPRLNIPRSRIKEIRINQNPYSAEFARPGSGRVEVVTKSGGTSLHGGLDFLLRDYRFDARNAFAAEKPKEQFRSFDANLSGPLAKSKKNTFVLSIWREEQDLESVVFASGVSGPIQQNVPNPVRSIALSGAVSRQIGKNVTASLGYDMFERSSSRDGVGGFVTADVGTSSHYRGNQISYSQKTIAGSKLVDDLSIRLDRTGGWVSSDRPGVPRITVVDAFTSGGAQIDVHTTATTPRFTNILSTTRGRHFIKTGIHIGAIRQGSTDSSNSEGSFYFSSLQDYLQNRPFSYVAQRGNPRLAFWEKETALFAQDEVRLRPNLSVAAGLRYEWQAFVSDHNNAAPRISIAYSPGKSRKTVIRAGGGIFYDRVNGGTIADLLRYRDGNLRQISVNDPGFPDPFAAAGSLLTVPPNLVRFAPGLRSPYRGVFGFSLERQLQKSTTLSASYQGTRGIKLFRSINLNAARPPLLTAPDPEIGIWRQIESSAHSEAQSLRISLRTSVRKFLTGNVLYTLSRSYDNAGGINSFPADNYNLSGEWTRSNFDVRHRVTGFASLTAPHKLFNLGIIVSANSGAPYNLTTGRDDNHDTFATDRPAGVRRNALQGPGFRQVDLRWSRAFTLARTKKDQGPYLTVSLDGFNILNQVNLAGAVGNLSSPFFGHSVAASWPRRMQVSVNLTY